MQISKIVIKRIILSMITLIIGVGVYWLFHNGILIRSNLVFTIMRNYLSDGLWGASFFFFAINFAENISKRYILLTSSFVISLGIIFELMQLMNLAKGTFDLIDIFVYVFAVIISCLVEKKLEEEKKYEKI